MGTGWFGGGREGGSGWFSGVKPKDELKQTTSTIPGESEVANSAEVLPDEGDRSSTQEETLPSQTTPGDDGKEKEQK